MYKTGTIYGYARVSTGGQSVAAQVAALTAAGAAQVFRRTASAAKTDRAPLRRAMDQLEAGDVLPITRLDRLPRSTRDLLNTLATIADRKAGLPVPRRHLGRHDYPTRPVDAGRAWWAGRVREKVDPRQDKRGSRPR